MTLMAVTLETTKSVNNCDVRTGGDLHKILILSPWNLKPQLFTMYVFIAQVYFCMYFLHMSIIQKLKKKKNAPTNLLPGWKLKTHLTERTQVKAIRLGISRTRIHVIPQQQDEL